MNNRTSINFETKLVKKVMELSQHKSIKDVFIIH